jgi:hypothetical protein
MNVIELSAAFPPDMIHWRAQSVTSKGDAAMALAYIDARDVMARLDMVCGPENWQDSYAETPSGRVLCTLTIRIGDEWVSKSDGAGSTDIEGDKGGLSDAFKRAAVKWGVGRYLYDMPCPWAPCESYERNGKHHWKKWTATGLQELRRVASGGGPAPTNVTPLKPKAEATDGPQESNAYLDFDASMRDCQTPVRLKAWLKENIAGIEKLVPAERTKLEDEYARYRDGLQLVATANS